MGVCGAQFGIQGAKGLEEASAAGLGHEAAMDTDAQPVSIGEFVADALMLAGRDEAQSRSEEAGGKRG